ncbi:bifunctional diguanylate cyclase/phosphodiesterase, partial [Rhizobium ruizarguesonis]
QNRPSETLLNTRDCGEIAVEVTASRIVYRWHNCEVLAVRDLTERRQAEEMIEHLAHHDVLTDLPSPLKSGQNSRGRLAGKTGKLPTGKLL